MEQAFRTLLQSSAAVTAIAPADRINCGAHPQGAGAPYVTISRPSHREGMTMTGRDGLMHTRIQCDCYAPTWRQARDLSDAVTNAASGHRSGGVQLVEFAGSREMGREGGTNEAERLHRFAVDFLVHWRAS